MNNPDTLASEKLSSDKTIFVLFIGVYAERRVSGVLFDLITSERRSGYFSASILSKNRPPFFG
ncbi:hypothetical protein CEV31_2425 [Brucella thiophenivorans]|uniref:Uncharacterized protein n=1 Tax=Brucella thiophenivorans TaxID=571255 RepID=A0A256FXB1_9HYPH|nr:hypothetical protein CEV31_2425 [Brucella thiophenivorans]